MWKKLFWLGASTVLITVATFASEKGIGKGRVEDSERIRKQIAEIEAGTRTSLLLNVRTASGRYLRIALSSATWHSDSQAILLKGRSYQVSHRPNRTSRMRRDWASGTLYRENGRQILQLSFSTESQQSSTRFYSLRYFPASDSLHTISAPEFALANKWCGDQEPLSLSSFKNQTAAASLAAVSEASYRELEIATDTDYECTRTYGSGITARIASILNATSAIYDDQLGIQLKVRSQAAANSSSIYPASFTDSSDLLERFRSYSNANHQMGSADVYFLYTCKNIDSNIVGLAWMGAVCEEPSYSYGMVQHVNEALDYVIFAHEIGHTLSAQHVSSGIMSSSLSDPAPTTFSQTSKDQILSHVASHGSCLATQNEIIASPTPTASPIGGSSLNRKTSPVPSLEGRMIGREFVGSVAIPEVIDGCRMVLKGKVTGAPQFTVGAFTPSSLKTDVQIQFRKRLRARFGRASLLAYHGCEGRDTSLSNVLPLTIVRSTSRTSTLSSFRGKTKIRFIAR